MGDKIFMPDNGAYIKYSDVYRIGYIESITMVVGDGDEQEDFKFSVFFSESEFVNYWFDTMDDAVRAREHLAIMWDRSL
jgi:hypothetical protein